MATSRSTVRVGRAHGRLLRDRSFRGRAAKTSSGTIRWRTASGGYRANRDWRSGESEREQPLKLRSYFLPFGFDAFAFAGAREGVFAAGFGAGAACFFSCTNGVGTSPPPPPALAPPNASASTSINM